MSVQSWILQLYGAPVIGFTRTQHSRQRPFLSQLIPSIDSFILPPSIDPIDR